RSKIEDRRSRTAAGETPSEQSFRHAADERGGRLLLKSRRRGRSFGRSGGRFGSIRVIERKRVVTSQTPYFLKHLVQALAEDELHGVVMNPILFADSEHRHDIRMVKSGGGPCLSLESLQVGRTQQAVKRQDF